VSFRLFRPAAQPALTPNAVPSIAAKATVLVTVREELGIGSIPYGKGRGVRGSPITTSCL
jgi:hypothetical protein